jgi:hypothetical protein
VAAEELPPEMEARITPVLFVGEFEHLTLACKTCGFTKKLTIEHN